MSRQKHDSLSQVNTALQEARSEPPIAPSVQLPLNGEAKSDARAVTASRPLTPIGVPAAAVLSGADCGPAEHGQRARTFVRQHMAFAHPAAERIFSRRSDRSGHGNYDRLVPARSLLGHAGAQGSRASSRGSLDTIGNGR